MLLALCIGDILHTYDHYSFHGDCILRTQHVLVHVSEQKCMLCTSPFWHRRRSGSATVCETNLIIMELGRIFVRINLRNWPKNSQWTRTKLLSAVRGVISTWVSIVSLRNEGFPTFCLCLTKGCHLGFTEKLRNLWSRRMFANSSWGNAATAFSLSSQFRVCVSTCYKLYSGKRCILGERKRLGGETVSLQYPVSLLRNIYINVKTRATTNVCLHVSIFCYETQHNQRLCTPSDRV